MRYTLLDLVQRILDSTEADEVSDINETQESRMVVGIIKECYFDIIGSINPAESVGLFKLDDSTDGDKPALMLMPSTASKLEWLKYDWSDDLTKPDYKKLQYVDNEEFFYYQNGYDHADTTVQTMTITINGHPYYFRYKTDRFPTYFTILFDKYIIFDAVNLAVENTATAHRSLAYGSLVPTFELNNNWVPDLDPRQFQLLLQEAKSTAFMELKQVQNPRAEMKARKNHILAQKNKYDNDPAFSNQIHAGFGRRGRFNPMKSAMRRGI